MKKTLKKYFIPHEGNNHKPHFLREKAVGVTALVVGLLFIASTFGNYLVSHNPYLASVKSAFLVDLTNKDRVEQGIAKLTINQTLVAAAGLKANDMSAKSYFAHVSPEGKSPWHWIQQAGYKYVYAGENLAVNFTSSEDVEEAWMNSPTHKKNIMNSRFSEIGIATAPGTYKGERTVFVVQMFGSPMPSNITEVRNPVSVSELSVDEVSLAVASEEEGENENVLGEETSSTLQPETELSPVDTSTASAAEMYVEFANPEISPEEIAQLEMTSDSAVSDAPAYTNWLERLLVSPSEVVQDLYMAIAALIIFALILKIFIEIRKQHPKNIAYGVLLLALVVFFMHLNSEIIVPPIVALM